MKQSAMVLKNLENTEALGNCFLQNLIYWLGDWRRLHDEDPL
jgi:hypothetical protein